MYYIIYEAISKDTTKIRDQKAEGTACFSGIWQSINLFKTIKVVVLKDYTKYSGGGNKMNYDDEQVAEYVKILNRFHNCITLDNTTKYSNRVVEPVPSFTFTIDNTNVFATKVIMNFLRYLHENSFIEIPGTLLKISKVLKFMPVYNKMVLSHYGSTYLSGGHDICGMMLKKLLDKKEIENIMSKYKDNAGNICNIMPQHGLISPANLMAMNKLRDKPKELWKFYLGLIPKPPAPKPIVKPVVDEEKKQIDYAPF